jgi:hypothetical protein
MHLLVAKSTFFYLGEKYEPGDFLRSKEAGADLDPGERPTSHWLSTNLCERPLPQNYDHVRGLEEIEGAILAHHGGGWYTVIDLDGDIYADKVQGEDAAIDAAKKTFESDSTDA